MDEFRAGNDAGELGLGELVRSLVIHRPAPTRARTSIDTQPAPMPAHASSEGEAPSMLLLLGRIGETLEGLNVAMCVFDNEDRTLLWNRAFLRLFPEHADDINAGEPYRLNLRRFYATRLSDSEMPSIERYIDEGIARHRQQERPFSFMHQGELVQVSSLPLDGLGRVRIWKADGLGATAPLLPASARSLQPWPPSDRGLLGQMADSVMLADLDGRITWVNEAFVIMYGLAGLESALSHQFPDVYRSAWAATASRSDPVYVSGQLVLEENLRFFGAPFDLPLPRGRWTRVTLQRGPDGNSLSTHVDITMMKRQQEDLRLAEERARSNNALLEAALERMQQGVMMVNADRIVEICNKRAIELLALPESLMASKPPFEAVLAYQWANDEFRHASQSLQDFVRAGGITDQPQCYDRIRPDGTIIEVQSVPIEGGGVLRTYTDITARKKNEERIRHVSRHDGLTSLVTREVFLECVATAIAAREQFAVHYIDLDRFKPVNDRFGHVVGDKVLAGIAERMRSIARDRDVVARMGGDEFAILQRDVPALEPAQGLVARIIEGVSEPIEIEGIWLNVGASVGLALYPGQANDVESLLREADAAMYAVKASRA